MLCVVTFTLNPARINAPLVKEIQNSTGWMHYFDNSWFIATNEDVNQLYTRLKPFFKDTDLFLIIEIRKQSTYQGWLPEKAWDWLKDAYGKGWATP